MKKLLVAVMALVLILMPMCASAVTIISSGTIENLVYFGSASNTYVTQVEGGYQIYNAAGEPVGPVWVQLGSMQNGLHYQVLNNGAISLINAKGEMVLPDNYFGFVAVEDWALGVVMEPTNDPVPDYTSGSGQGMKFIRADVVKNGEKLGTLTREQYLPSAKAGVVGGFLYIQHANGRCLWFDTALNMTAETFGDPVEFKVENGVYIHVPTQQQAFVPTCTLTPDQVGQAAMLIGNEVLDLQGNLITAVPDNSTLRVAGNYCCITMGGYIGMWNLQGQMIIPPEYTYIADPHNQNVTYFPSGYQAAVTPDNIVHFYNEAGEITAKSNVAVRTLGDRGFLMNAPVFVQSTEDRFNPFMLITATAGQLTEQYTNVLVNFASHHIISVMKNGLFGCIDLNGNAPFPIELADYPNVSNDGTLVIGERYDHTMLRYQLDYSK